MYLEVVRIRDQQSTGRCIDAPKTLQEGKHQTSKTSVVFARFCDVFLKKIHDVTNSLTRRMKSSIAFLLVLVLLPSLRFTLLPLTFAHSYSPLPNMRNLLSLTFLLGTIFGRLSPAESNDKVSNLGTSHGPCKCDVDGKPCPVDGYVGSGLIYEDDFTRVWNFTLAPGEMTSMHRHDYDYHFVAIQPTQLEVWGEDGSRLFDFRAEGVLGFKLVGEFLEPIGIDLPWPVPRTHSAKNIGDTVYYEILFEKKNAEQSSSSGGFFRFLKDRFNIEL